MKAILRFDDYSASSDIRLERRVLEVVAEAGHKMVMAIIPFVADLEWKVRGPISLLPLPRAKVELLRPFVPQCAEIALHGYCHQAIGQILGLMEFGDRIPRELQLARLQDGKKYLEDLFGVELKAFVPPWNAYGATTSVAVREAGFSLLSGDAGFGSLAEGLAYVPATCGMEHLPGAVKAAQIDAEALVCINLHEYDFKESGSPDSRFSIQEFKDWLQRSLPAVQWCRFEDCLEVGTWTAERAEANQELRTALRSPLRHLFSPATQHVYWSAAAARGRLRRLSVGSRLLRLVSCGRSRCF